MASVGALALISGAATAAPPEASPVATQPDEIIVTATKQGSESLQRVPLAVTAFTSNMIAARGSVSLADLASATPGFTYSFNSVWSIASIRGIGTNNVFAGGDPSTTLQVDGVYYGRPTGANLDFLDVDRVEVLRGPQGTLYGRNAIGGTVNIITSDPSDHLEGQFRLTTGSKDLVRAEARVSVPVNDRLAFSIAVRRSDHGAYTKELNPAVPDNWDEHRYAIRGKLKFKATDKLTLVLSADYNHSNESINGYTVRLSPLLVPDGFEPNFHQAALSDPNYGIITQKGTSARVNWDLGSAQLTSITAYRTSYTQFGGDLDFSAAPLFDTRSFTENENQLSQEVDLSGSLGSIHYVVGGFAYRERARSAFNAVVFGTLLTQGIDALTHSYAGFGQFDLPLLDRLRFTGGVRYTIDQKSADNIYGSQVGGVTSDLEQRAAGTVPIFSGRNTRHAATPKFGLEYQATHNLLAYASITRGFKSGGYNLLIDPTSTAAAQYGPEHVWAYETGLKLSIPAIRGHLNLAGFYYDYTGLQVNQFVFLGSTVAQLVNNAKAANIKGLEAEGSLRPLPQWELGGTLAYLRARYAGYFPAIDNFTNTTTNPDGRVLNDAPKWSGSVFSQWTVDLGGVTTQLRGDATYKSRVYYTPLNDPRLGAPPRWLFNAGVTITPKDSPVEVGGRVDNIANKNYITAAYYTFSAGGQPGEPRTWRVFFGYKF